MTRTGRLRWLVPVGVASVAVAASVALPALSAAAQPALPAISAQQLLARALGSDVQTFSGTVRTETDLGIPVLPDQLRSSELGSLLTGAGTLRVATSGEAHQRLAVLGSTSERDFVRGGRDLWVYDSARSEAVHTTLPAEAGSRTAAPLHDQVTPDRAAKALLRAAGEGTDVSVGRAGSIAGRDAYQLVLRPTSAESLVGSVSVFVDAKTWMPLALRVLPRGSADPAVDVAYTELSYATPPASTFRFTPPPGTTVKQHHERGWFAYGSGDAGRAHSTEPDHVVNHTFSWTRVVQLGDVTGARGQAGAYLHQLRAAGSRVSGEFGSGTLVRTRLVTLLVLDDGRAFAGAVTPRAVEAAAAKH